MGKGEIACYKSNFSFSNSVFKRLVSQGVSKGVIAWEWVKAVAIDNLEVAQMMEFVMEVKNIVGKREGIWRNTAWSIKYYEDFHQPTNSILSHWWMLVLLYLSISEREKPYEEIWHEVLNLFPNKPWFLRVYSKSLLKTLWEKEKLLVTSNFSFSHSVFYQVVELLPFSYHLKLSSANSFSLAKSKICRMGKG